MPATLYEALGVPQSASNDDVRAALRRQIRKYYATTRDGHGDIEEALRFINHASRILTDPERRAAYDDDLAVATGTAADRIAGAVDTASGEAGAEGRAVPRAPAQRVRQASGHAAGADTEREVQHPGLTARIASVGRTTTVDIALCGIVGALIAAAIVLATPPDAVAVARQVLTWVTAALLAAGVVYAVVHGIARRQRRSAHARADLPAAPPIFNWRRERSVFLGTNQPQEDANWIFRLRMAELERAKAQRTSEPRPWNRLGARLFDYAIWGLILAVVLAEMLALGAVSPALAEWLSNPLVAPIAISASWIPIEALSIAAAGTTPGKWLFGVYLQFAISDAYAVDTWRQRFGRALARAFGVWWMGVGGGILPIAPIAAAVARERLAAQQETPWDSAQDCLVTHVPAGNLNVATGVAGLIAMLWVYGVAWREPLANTLAVAKTAITARVPAVLAETKSGAALLANAGSAAIGRAGVIATDIAPERSLPVIESAMPIDPDLQALVAERKTQVAMLSSEGPRFLAAGNYARAAALCGAWTGLDLDNGKAWACYGRALQAQGRHYQAVQALRKARQYDPTDGTLDSAINRSQRGIVADFLARGGM
jgi:uncharacterized RDD family membrane protein YckC